MTELRDRGLLLRPWQDEDVAALPAAADDREIARFMPSFPSPYTEADARTWVAVAQERWKRGDEASFAILDRRSGALLGGVGIHFGERPSVGYWLRRDARGRGLVPRAVELVLDWARRERGVERVELRAHPANTASQRVAEKCGFRRVGLELHDPPFRDGETCAVLFERDASVTGGAGTPAPSGP